MGGCRGNHVPLELQYFIAALLDFSIIRNPYEQTPTSISFKKWASRRGDSGKSPLGLVFLDPDSLAFTTEPQSFCRGRGEE
jgi:hypothetical protein